MDFRLLKQNAAEKQTETELAELNKNKIPAFILDHFHPHQWSPSTTWHTQHSSICRPQLQPPTLFYIKVEESEMDVLKKTVSAKLLHRTKKKETATYGKANPMTQEVTYDVTLISIICGWWVSQSRKFWQQLAKLRFKGYSFSVVWTILELVQFVASECCSCDVCRHSICRSPSLINFLITILLTR